VSERRPKNKNIKCTAVSTHLKIYKDATNYIFEEMELKDTEMVNRGIGPSPLYGYFYENSPVTLQGAGKVEVFLDGLRQVGHSSGFMAVPGVYREVARNFAKIHLIPHSELPLSIKYNDCEYWNWNTNCTYQHLKTAWGGGNPGRVARKLGIRESDMDND